MWIILGIQTIHNIHQIKFITNQYNKGHRGCTVMLSLKMLTSTGRWMDRHGLCIGLHVQDMTKVEIFM